MVDDKDSFIWLHFADKDSAVVLSAWKDRRRNINRYIMVRGAHKAHKCNCSAALCRKYIPLSTFSIRTETEPETLRCVVSGTTVIASHPVISTILIPHLSHSIPVECLHPVYPVAGTPPPQSLSHPHHKEGHPKSDQNWVCSEETRQAVLPRHSNTGIFPHQPHDKSQGTTINNHTG
ncbi:hypothetical protein Pelo_17478 [Pelomyxa schiedti]|nr:hypothetical protein Pelo_17478 [Pelomyxa schiedti]